MTTSDWMLRVRRAAAAAALGLAVVAIAMPAGVQAADDEDDPNSIWNLDKRILDGFMRGLGFRNGQEAEIEYRERSPLVLPPTRSLPAPEATGSTRSAAWPVDPDVKRRQDIAAAKRKKLDRRGYDEEYESRNLLPSELGGSAPPRTASRPVKPGEEKDEVEGTPMRPSELGYFGGLFSAQGFGFGGNKEEVGTFTKEPPRVNLTAPPAGYQTPSPTQPYGVGKNRERQTVTPLDPAVGSLGN